MENFLGELRLVPYTFAPRGWAVCEGQLLPINQNQALFALLGTNFGGNGKTTFALPDLRGRVGPHNLVKPFNHALEAYPPRREKCPNRSSVR